MPLDTAWMDDIPAAAPTAGMVLQHGGGAGPASFGFVAPHPAPDNSGTTTNLSDEDYAKFMAGRPPPSGAAPKADTSWMDAIPSAAPTAAMQLAHGETGAPKGGGIVANAGAGTSEAVAETLGALPDLATGAINAGLRGVHALARPLNAAIGAPAPPAEAPQITNPVGGSESLKSLFGYVGADPRTVEANNQLDRLARAGGAGAASMLLPMAGARALPAMAGIPGAVQQALGAGGAPTMATAGALGGAAGQEAADSVPDPYKPIANFGGQVLGGGIPIAATAAVKGAASALAPMARNYIAPLTQSGQQALAGQRIAHAASDIGAVHEALANPPPAIVPGSEPTTYQLTGDQGLGTLERVAAKDNSDAFLSRAAQQNKARVEALNMAPAGSPQAVGAAFRAHLAAIDQAGEAATGAARTQAQTATDAMGGVVPHGADQQATALQSYGQQLRGGLDEANQAARARVSRLYDAVDPDGTLAVDMGGIKEAARGIASDMPKNAAPLEGDAAAILGVAQMQPKVQSFREVAALRSRITDAMREELYTNGRSQTHRRLTQLLKAVDDTLAHGVEEAPPGVGDRLDSIVSEENGRPVSGVGSGQGAAAGSAGGTGGVPGAGGAEGQGPARSGDGGGDSTVAAKGAANRVGRAPASLLDFLIERGGLKPDADLSALDADKYHHRQGGRLVNKNGSSLDYAREAAVEAGYPLPSNDINGLRQAIGDELAGRKVYRPEDTAEAQARWESDVNAGREEAARHRAQYDITTAESDAGVRLSPAAFYHAIEMRMQGAHPHDAIMSAMRPEEDAALERNATAGAMQAEGMLRPGVNPAAHQAEMPADSGLTPNFDAAAAARYRAANAGHAERVGTFEEAPGVGSVLASGKRAGEWRLGDSQVAATIFNSGKGAAERVQAFLKAGGDNAALTDDLRDYAAFSLRRAAEGADGTLDPGKFDRWMKAHREAMAAFPDLADKFQNAAAARTTMDEAAARHLAAREEFEKSAASHFLGDADPVARIGRILRSDTVDATMKELAAKTENDPAAREGLRRAVVEHILNELRSNSLAGDTTERAFKQDVFQTFVRRAAPSLRHIFEPEEVEMIQNVARDIQRSQRSVTATKLPGGSNTAQDLAAGEKHGGGKPSVLGLLVAAEAAGEAAQHVAGPFARAVGMIAVPVVNAMRQEGLRKVDDLVTEAMLHPAIARALLAKVPQGSFAKPVLANAAKQILTLSGVAGVRSTLEARP